jgi:dihydroneopterin triphosphate diphosphatase
LTKIVTRTVEVCVFRLEGDVAKFLLLKRSPDEDLYPGIWQFVTGTMKEGETAVESALRELQEETGLQKRGFWVAPFVSSFYVAVNDTVHLSPFFAAQVAEQEKVRLSSEHQEFQWCTFEAAKEKLVWPGQLQGLQIVRDYIVGKREASRLLLLQV